jgi:DNA invertase Pin-like site-specific DNA recombinase
MRCIREEAYTHDHKRHYVVQIGTAENIDTQTSAGQFFFHIAGAFAELE